MPFDYVLDQPTKVTMTAKKPLFIAVEGIDGAGKTTLAKEVLVPLLGAEYVSVLDSGPISKLVRKQLMEHPEISDMHQTFFMTAALLETHNLTIKPLLESGKNVVVDRWLPSVYAYQLDTWMDECKILPVGLFNQITSRESALGITPSCYVYVTVGTEAAQDRCEKRGNKDRMDGAAKSELMRRSVAYNCLFGKMGVPFFRFDNNAPGMNFTTDAFREYLTILK